MGTSETTDTAGLVPNRACRNCVQIKVRCTPLAGSPDNVCQRCFRLGKTCTTPAPASRKQRVKINKVRRLEQRIDELTALVVSGNNEQLPTPNSDFLPTRSAESSPAQTAAAQISATQHTDAASATQRTTRTDVHHDGALGSDNDAAEPSTSLYPCSMVRTGSPVMQFVETVGRKDGSQLRTQIFCPVHLGADLEARLFREFRNEMAKHFPFVIVEEDADTLRSTKPFLYWACILAASHRDKKLHPLLYDEMLKAIGHRLLVAGDKSLDMLQGLLLMAAWSQSISHLNPQLMNLLHLVQALLADTGLLKPIRVHDKIRVASDSTAFLHGKESTAVKMTIEERRALLGFYCFSWKSALTFNRIDPMRHSQHIDSCCESLKLQSDRRSDLLIVELVHLYRIVGKFFDVDCASANSSSMYHTMFLDEIRRFRHNLPAQLVGNLSLELEILGSSICVIEPSYTAGFPSKVEHLNAFHNCVETGNRLVEVLMSIPNEEYPSMTFLTTMTLVQIMTVFSRLSFFKSNSWDTRYSCSNVKLDIFLEKMAIKYTEIHELEMTKQAPPQNLRWYAHACTANRIKDWYRAKVAAEQAVYDTAMDEVMPNTFSEDPFGNFDDSFWHDLLCTWKDL